MDCVYKLTYATKEFKEYLLSLLRSDGGIDDFGNYQGEVKFILDTYPSSFTLNLDKYINDYYEETTKNDEYGMKIKNHFLKFVKKYLFDEFKLPYLEENLDSIDFNDNYTQILEDLISFFNLKYNDVPKDELEEDGFGGSTSSFEGENDEEMEQKNYHQIIIQLGSTLYDLSEKENLNVNISEYAKNLNNTFRHNLEKYDNKTNELVEDMKNLKDNSPDFTEFFTIFEGICELYPKVFTTSYPPLREEDFSKDYFGEGNETLTPVFKEMFFNLSIDKIKEMISNYNNNSIGNLIGYTMINCFNYIEEP